MTADDAAAPSRQPLLRVVRGRPDELELAALVAVVAARQAATAAPDRGRPRVSAWSDPSALLRTPLHPAPGAWRASALPR